MTNSTYQPPDSILENYAKVLVHFALGNDEGIEPNQVVQLLVPDLAKPLAAQLQKQVLQAGAHPLLQLLPTGLERDFFQLANQHQLSFFPQSYLQERVNLIDHSIGIIADPFPTDLAEVDPQKIVSSRDAKKAYRDWLIDKETSGHFTWTLALWGVEAKAEIVGLSLKEYWQQIIRACYLDQADPIASWRKTKSLQQKIREKLNRLKILWLDIEGPDVELKIKLGENRLWKGGADRNIPSFELFTSPDWRGSQGWIRFNQPVYRYGNLIDGIQLQLKDGVVVSAAAKKGQAMLKQMLKSKNADRLGEFSLTDNRLSNITHFMAETLYDENVGGPEGNMHVAIGSAYRDCYRGDQSKLTNKDWRRLGFNDSAEHTDIVSTTPRIVTATLKDGSQKIIYQAGQFQL